MSAATEDVPHPASGRRLRILITALWYFPEHPSGSSRLAYDEAKYLASLGHEVWLVAMDGGTGQPEHVVEDGVHVLRHRRPRWAGIDPTGRHVRVIRRLLRSHLGDQVDVVHGHMLLPTAAAFGLYAGRARTTYSLHSLVKAELLAARRGAPLLEQARLRIAATLRHGVEARLLALSDTVTCDSEYTRRLAAEVHGAATAQRLRVVPGWVDLSRFQIIEDRNAAKRSLGWPVDRPVLFCLRRFVPRMGLERLVRTAADLARAGRRFHLVMGGDGPLRPSLATEANEAGLAPFVEFPGMIPDAQLPKMYGAADAFVLPTAELECFGLIALEALACGRPVLATPVGAIPEILERVEARWIAPDNLASGIASLLEAFLAGRLPLVPSDRLRASIEGRYSMEHGVAQLAAFAIDGLEAA